MIRFARNTVGGITPARTARTWHRVLGALGIVVLLSCAAGSAIAQTAGSAGPVAKPVLRIGLSGLTPDATSWDPANETGADSAFAVGNSLAYAPILGMKPDGKVVPGLATSWRWLKTNAGEHKKFEFTLRRNARFSDGTKVTAQAVAAWLDHYSKGPNPYATYLGPNPKFQAVGKWKVRVTLTVPTPDLPETLAALGSNWAYVAGPRAVKDPNVFANGPLGAGPYKLDASRTVSGDHYTYVPNPYYYDKAAVRFSQVLVKILPISASRLQSLQTGQLDVILGEPSIASAARSSGFNIAWAPTSSIIVPLDTKRDISRPLSDVRVRRAINYAINRKAISQAIVGQYGGPIAAYPITDCGCDFSKAYTYNPRKAKSLLAAAGYSKGFKLTVLAPAGNADRAKVAQAVASYLNAVGIDADAKLSSRFGADLFSWTYPAFMAGSAVTTTSLTYGTWFNPNSILNVTKNDPRIPKLYYDGLKAKNPKIYWKKLWKHISDQAYQLETTTYPTMYIASKKMGGVTITKARPSALPTEWFRK